MIKFKRLLIALVLSDLFFSGHSPDVVRLNLRNRSVLKVQVSVWSGPHQTCFEASHSLKLDRVDWIDYNSSHADADDEEQYDGEDEADY